MDSSTAKSRNRSLLAMGLALTATLAVGVAPASARTSTFLSFSVGLPLYAGPPAYSYGPYYAPYYYAPAPVYYAPPPVIVTPAPVAPVCRSGLWRQTDGSVVNGVACFQPNGTWHLNNY